MRRRIIVFFSAASVVLLAAAGGSPQDKEISLREKIVATAKTLLGAKYRYGGTGGSGFDCSGFVASVYGKNGIILPHSSKAQYRGEKAKKADLPKALPGDLVFFSIRGATISHVGIYLGDNSFIHAPSRGKKIMVSRIDESYWKKRFAGAVTYIYGD